MKRLMEKIKDFFKDETGRFEAITPEELKDAKLFEVTFKVPWDEIVTVRKYYLHKGYVLKDYPNAISIKELQQT